MKRKIIFAICLLLLISLIGCKAETTQTGPNPPITGQATITQQDINDVDATSQDLDTSSLDNVSAEVDNITW